MNRVAIALMLLRLCTSLAVADQSADTRYREGLDHYRNAQYRQAIAAFEQLLDEGYASLDLYYNLGNAAYKNGDLGLSVLSYERALVRDPGNDDVRHNLRVVRARLRDRVDPIPLLFFVQWWEDLKTGSRPETAFAWSLAFFTLFTVAAFVFFGIRQVTARRIALVAGVLLLAASAAALALVVQRTAELNARRDAIVMRSEVAVRSAPDATGVESFIVHEGLKVRILETRSGQHRIRLADGKTGWIEQAALARI